MKKIKENLARASKFQVSRGKRREGKFSFDHDARIYYLISENRNKSNGGELSLGYDTYLLTLDGSLPYFLKEEGLPWTETYFLFPNQWYELAFPFLRLHTNEAARGLAFMAFSPVFSTLGELIPLELCKYIFDLGGENLTFGSIKAVIESSMEERLLDSLDPSKKDNRKREKAKLEVQRLIAEKELQQRKTAEEVNQIVQETERKHELLEGEVNTLERQKEELYEELHQIQIDVKNQREIKAVVDQVTAQYEEKLSLQQAEYDKNLSEIQTTASQKLEKKETSLTQQEKEIETLQTQVSDLQETMRDIKAIQDQDQESRERQNTQRIEKITNLKKTVIAVLMIVGMVLSLGFLLQFNIEIWLIILSIALMGIGLAFYQWLSGRFAFLSYGLGMITATGAIFFSADSQTWLWIIPMGWEIVVFSIDKIFDRQAPDI